MKNENEKPLPEEAGLRRMVLIERKKNQILEILSEEEITYGMAKTVLSSVENTLSYRGTLFLNDHSFKEITLQTASHPQSNDKTSPSRMEPGTLIALDGR